MYVLLNRNVYVYFYLLYYIINSYILLNRNVYFYLTFNTCNIYTIPIQIVICTVVLA